MNWYDDPDHPFAGIAEKLKRADENIVNLHTEVDLFIQSGEYPVIPYPNSEDWQKAVLYHKNKPIPLKFAVLVGEIVHHLRSCLDHIVWHFSDDLSRQKPGGMEFPIFAEKPTERKELEAYARKVKGIHDTDILRLIEEMQPYNTSDVDNSVLLILHDMDRFDKHRELVIVASGLLLSFPPDSGDLLTKADLYNQGKLRESEHFLIGRALHDYQATPSISFPEFGTFRPYSVIRGLAQIWMVIRQVAEDFAEKI
jgi:hypothetical protein